MVAFFTRTLAQAREFGSGKLARTFHHEDVPALTGLRFLAAFSVLIAHSFSIMLLSHETPMGAIYWLRQSSGFGMTLFFVLSGFVIHYNYAASVTEEGLRGIAAYLWARFARLYPLFLLMMMVYILVSSRFLDFWTGHPERFQSIVKALPYFLLSVQSWIYMPIDGNSLISAIGGASPLTWSISTEWFFYIVYPFLAWFVLCSRRPWITAALAVLWCALWMALSANLYDRSPQIDSLAIAHFGPVAGLKDHQQDSFVRWLLYYSPYLRVGEFALGAIIAQLYVQLKTRSVTWHENLIGTVIFILATASVLLITYLEYSPAVSPNVFWKTSLNFALAPSAALLVFTAARYRNLGSRMLTSRPIIALGEASYSIYLIHYVVLLTILRLTGSAMHGIVYDAMKVVLVMMAILLIALMLYKYYEAPTRKWLRKKWPNTGSRAAIAEAPWSLML
jgi:peptidoglycan/LPS O-acetylase OafA/YrhL